MARQDAGVAHPMTACWERDLLRQQEAGRKWGSAESEGGDQGRRDRCAGACAIAGTCCAVRPSTGAYHRRALRGQAKEWGTDGIISRNSGTRKILAPKGRAFGPGTLEGRR